MQPGVATPGSSPTLTRGGLVFRVGARRQFLPADLALKVVPRPQIARIPGAPPGLLGLALAEGAILPVIELDGEGGAMIVCSHHGERLGLVGAVDIASGMFPASDASGVLFEGEAVRELDLEELYGRVHTVSWGAAWG